MNKVTRYGNKHVYKIFVSLTFAGRLLGFTRCHGNPRLKFTVFPGKEVVLKFDFIRFACSIANKSLMY